MNLENIAQRKDTRHLYSCVYIKCPGKAKEYMVGQGLWRKEVSFKRHINLLNLCMRIHINMSQIHNTHTQHIHTHHFFFCLDFENQF
jgi:hypothetical protein